MYVYIIKYIYKYMCVYVYMYIIIYVYIYIINCISIYNCLYQYCGYEPLTIPGMHIQVPWGLFNTRGEVLY